MTPLLDAGLTKDQVRAASRRWDLPTWDKPAAACLSSRIAYGVEITPHRLARVERAEAVVRRRGCRRGPQPAGARPRRRGPGSRSTATSSAASTTASCWRAVREAGFADAEVDPLGFRSGRDERALADPDRYR